MTTAQVKSKQRVSDHGEVFTAEREVNAMLDLVKQETERVDSRFLEPACGDGNFVVEILHRKLAAAKKRATPPKRQTVVPFEFEKQSVIAVASIYGVDLLQDNVIACRQRLYDIWNTEYEAVCGNEVDEACRSTVQFILSRNIVCGNALTLMCVDEHQQDTRKPIIFSEWTLPFNDTRIQRKDYSFAELMQSATIEDSIRKTGQMDLFADRNGEVEPIFLQQYIFDYRRPQNYDTQP
jgi:hypothetical protein